MLLNLYFHHEYSQRTGTSGGPDAGDASVRQEDQSAQEEQHFEAQRERGKRIYAKPIAPVEPTPEPVAEPVAQPEPVQVPEATPPEVLPPEVATPEAPPKPLIDLAALKADRDAIEAADLAARELQRIAKRRADDEALVAILLEL
jgi:hypothetical protein